MIDIIQIYIAITLPLSFALVKCDLPKKVSYLHQLIAFTWFGLFFILILVDFRGYKEAGGGSNYAIGYIWEYRYYFIFGLITGLGLRLYYYFRI